LGDDSTKLHRLANTVEARLRQAQEETEKATQDLTQVRGVLIEKHSVVEQEKISLQSNFDEEKSQLQQEKEQLLMEQLEVTEVVNRALHSMTILEIKTED